MALRAIWQFMDRDVTHKIFYGPKRSWGPYAILWVTDRFINCHLARSCHELFVILYSILANLLDDMFFVIVYLRQKKQFGQNPEENIIFIGPGQYIANSSWHWGSYGSIWTGPSPKQYYMDRSLRSI